MHGHDVRVAPSSGLSLRLSGSIGVGVRPAPASPGQRPILHALPSELVQMWHILVEFPTDGSDPGVVARTLCSRKCDDDVESKMILECGLSVGRRGNMRCRRNQTSLFRVEVVVAKIGHAQ